MNPLDDVRGASLPFRIDPATGSIAMTSGDAKVADDIAVIIGTRLGERPMLRSFGTRIPGLVHSPDDDILVRIALDQAVEALLQWEPRIIVTNSAVEPPSQPGEVRLRLDYVHTNSQVAGTAVLPVSRGREVGP